MSFLGSSSVSSSTALEGLVNCPCGHTLGLHSARGCDRCRCHANRDDVLEADIDLARRELRISPNRLRADER